MSLAAPVRSEIRAWRPHATRERVDVWQVPLGSCPGTAAHATLSDPERQLAERLRVASASWVAARAALRRILGRYLAIDPAAVVIETGPEGKPRLAPGGWPDLRFNLSHSGDVVLIALRLGCEVGVDVERIRSVPEAMAIAREVFAVSDRAGLDSMCGEERNEAFFRLWVRREAIAKATGRGIVTPPAADEATRFTVRDLDAGPGVAAAIASQGGGWDVRWVGGIFRRGRALL